MSYEAALTRISRIGQAATDSRTLRSQVLVEMGGVVPFDTYVWALTDPETSVGTEPLASIPPPLMPALPRLIRLKYLTGTNRWTGLAATARLATPTASLVWRELLQSHGVADVASTVFRDRYGCWAFLDLWRAGGTFTDLELAFLDAIAYELTAHLRRCQAATFTATGGAADAGPVVLLLGADLRVLGQTPQTHDYLVRLLPPGEGMEPIPASAYNVAAQLIAVEAGVDSQPPYARVHLAAGRWLALRAARLSRADSADSADGADGADGADAQIAVTIEQASPAERSVVFGRASGLSARETELLTHLTAGSDTRTVAERMYLSENTVQDHLKSIFNKTGTRNRRTLLSRALGTA